MYFVIVCVAEFEADLQEVWSVRKNIHHQGTSAQASQSSSAPSIHNQVKAELYSRHGAIPAQQTGGPKPLFGAKGKGTCMYKMHYLFVLTSFQ